MPFYIPEKTYALQVQKSYLDTLFFQICLFLKAVLMEDGLRGGKVYGKVRKRQYYHWQFFHFLN